MRCWWRIPPTDVDRGSRVGAVPSAVVLECMLQPQPSYDPAVTSRCQVGMACGNRSVDMPVTFYDREQAFEARFARDEEFRFLVHARRDKLFSRWAAAMLNMPAE